MKIPGLTQRQIEEAQRVVSVLIQKYASFYGEEPQQVLRSLTLVLNDLAQTEPDISELTTEEFIINFNRQHNQQSRRYSVVAAPSPFDLTSEPDIVFNTNKLETAMQNFRKRLSVLSTGWLALISNEDRRIIGEVKL